MISWQTLVFDDSDHIVKCLDEILRDDDIEVVRIKNTMREGCDERNTGGFRFVYVSISIYMEHYLKADSPAVRNKF